MKKILLLTIFILSILTLKAQIFSQDFNGTTDYTTLVSATPNSNQFNAIGTASSATTVGIVSSKLKYSRSTVTNANGSFTRNTDFSPVPQIIIYKVDVELTGNTASQTSAAVFQVGTGFSSGSNSPESNAKVHSRFSINMETTSGQFSVRDINASVNGTGTYSGSQTLTWVINNSSSSYSYTPPNGVGTETVAADTWDLFVGNTKELNDRAAQSASIDLKNLKFAFTDGIGALTLDNISVESITPLPIQLSAFTGRAISQSILLNWHTASEINNDYFDILRSADGKSFTTIGTSKGFGTSTNPHDYNFTDENPFAGTNYYQLVQHDFDGKTSTSNIIPVDSKISSAQLSVYAAATNIKVSLSSPNKTKGLLQVFDISGRKILENNIEVSKGYNNFSLPLSLPNGVHFVSYTAGNLVINQKFIK
ncbi:T9SS type A sorting domain-containing protein [Pedobacter sp. SD-b]|uniref:T9SS type A sorting domain-containing protein n=1 Tax=Pedobacter segetis TaxID=2793069 RepID=A0ABS1BKC4_9SPHI|nr:T9SS type A sorting domain-containing protein [Pedobacter segetis]MBK0383296.1 T9SS type A sorting domain-containing protein [Pedobacter segetis]